MIFGGDVRRGQRSGSASALIQLKFCLCALHRVFSGACKTKRFMHPFINPVAIVGTIRCCCVARFCHTCDAIGLRCKRAAHCRLVPSPTLACSEFVKALPQSERLLAQVHPLSVVVPVDEYNIQFQREPRQPRDLWIFTIECFQKVTPNITRSPQAASKI